jgi:hypothetical protein
MKRYRIDAPTQGTKRTKPIIVERLSVDAKG